MRNTGYDYEQTDGRGNTTQTVYDEYGRVASTIDALGYSTAYGYDALGRQISVTDPLTNTVTTAYDAEGRVIAQRGATYPVDYSYDEFGNKTTMTTYRDLSGERGMGNGEAGSCAVQGDVTRWLRDEATGLVTNKVYADGKGPTYTYTPDGKLATRTWARGIVTTYSYDDNGALTNTVYSDGTPTILLAYNRAGRQIQAIDAAGVTTFLYDGFGAVTNETVVGVAGTNTIERFYDNFGRSLGYSLNGLHQSTLAYDPATERLVTMLAAGSDTPFTWNYLVGSDLKSSLAYPNGLTASWTYDANGQLLQVKNAFSTNTISQYDYVYDAAGRRINVSKSGTAFNHDDTIAYGYNEKSELTNAVAAVDAAYRYSYDFDEIGNRESSSERGTNSVYTANDLNQYTAVDDFAPQFDDDGNQTLVKTETGVWQVTYNGENRPIHWSNGSANIVMSFDRMGRRVMKNDLRFVYDGYLQIANFKVASTNSQLTTHNLQLFIWDPTEPGATRPLVWFNDASTAFYTHDGNKNVSEVIFENGEITACYDYAPFGDIAAQYGASAASNLWQFSSEFFDGDTATVYYNYRHYEPLLGRWLRRDPLCEEKAVLYTYCGNSLAFDALGLQAFSDFFDPGFNEHFARPSQKPELFDQMFGWLFCFDRHYEEYFDSRYHDTMNWYREYITDLIRERIDCKAISVLPDNHSWLMDAGYMTIFDLFDVAQGGYQRGNDLPQRYYERNYSLGSFSIDIDPVKITYLSDCVDGKREYIWETKMFVVDTTGFRRGEWRYYFVGWWLFRECRLKMASWLLSGSGHCSCCEDKEHN